MVVSSFDLALVILAGLAGSLVFGGIAKGLGWDVPTFLLVGGGIPLLTAGYWHFRVVADKEAAYVRQTDAKTQATLATIPRDDDDSDDAPNIPPTTVSLTGDLDEAERYVQSGLRLTLELGRAYGGLTWELIGHAFANTRAWVWWTGILAASKLAVKVNGAPTVLPEGRTYAWALRQVRQGYFEMPALGTDAPLPPLPQPVSTEGVEKVKPVEVLKA